MNNYSQTTSGLYSVQKTRTPQQYIRGQGELTPGFVPYSPIASMPMKDTCYNRLIPNEPQRARLPGSSIIAYRTDIFN